MLTVTPLPDARRSRQATQQEEGLGAGVIGTEKEQGCCRTQDGVHAEVSGGSSGNSAGDSKRVGEAIGHKLLTRGQ